MRTLPMLVLLLVLAALPALARAQDTSARARDSSLLKFIQQSQTGKSDKAGAAPGSPIVPPVWCASIGDGATTTRCWQAYQAMLGYYETGLQHRTAVFAWQHTSTRIIFFVVLGLVLVGVYFAWLQFHAGLSVKKGAAPAPEHSIEISLQGIKASSPVLGVIILALSLAFFYLYLVYVYPISEIF